ELSLDEVDERIEPFRNQCAPVNTLEHLEILRGVQERQVVPTLEAVVGPAGHGQKLIWWREVFRAHAEPRRHELADDLPVERVAVSPGTSATLQRADGGR